MSFGSYYSTGHYMTTCGDGLVSERIAFGFRLVSLRLYNSCTDRLFFNLNTSATTQDDFIAGCSALVLNPFPVSGYQEVTTLDLRTTSTSTGAGLPLARPFIGISAWGSA